MSALVKFGSLVISDSDNIRESPKKMTVSYGGAIHEPQSPDKNFLELQFGFASSYTISFSISRLHASISDAQQFLISHLRDIDLLNKSQSGYPVAFLIYDLHLRGFLETGSATHDGVDSEVEYKFKAIV